MLAFDMSEYMERHTVSRLIGAPPDMWGMRKQANLQRESEDSLFRGVVLMR